MTAGLTVAVHLDDVKVFDGTVRDRGKIVCRVRLSRAADIYVCLDEARELADAFAHAARILQESEDAAPPKRPGDQLLDAVDSIIRTKP